MTLRRGFALVLLLVAVFVLWREARSILMLMERGSGLSDALLNPPLSAIKVAGAMLAVIGGGLAASGRGLGGSAGLLGGLIFAAAPALFAMLSPNPMSGLRDGIPALLMIVAAIGLLFQKRTA